MMEQKICSYTLDAFQQNIESFMKNRWLSLDNPNLIDESNVLDFVSDESGSYFPQLHLIDTI